MRRGFSKREWNRQYVFGPSQGSNSLVWEFVPPEGPGGIQGFPNPSRAKSDEDEFWLFQRKSRSQAGLTVPQGWMG